MKVALLVLLVLVIVSILSPELVGVVLGTALFLLGVLVQYWFIAIPVILILFWIKK